MWDQMKTGSWAISRKIQGDGKKPLPGGGAPCTVLQLKALGAQLIDIHGQHDGQQLLDETCHLGYLDSFGGLEEVREAYREEYDRLDHIRRQIASLQMDEAEKARRIDTLQFQIAELERANLQPGEEEELEERKGILRSADQLMDAVGSAYYAVFGTDSQSGRLREPSGRGGKRIVPGGRPVGGVVPTVLCGVRTSLHHEDVAERLRDVRESMRFSPQELDSRVPPGPPAPAQKEVRRLCFGDAGVPGTLSERVGSNRDGRRQLGQTQTAAQGTVGQNPARERPSPKSAGRRRRR